MKEATAIDIDDGAARVLGRDSLDGLDAVRRGL